MMVSMCNSLFVITTIKTRTFVVYCVLNYYYFVHWEVERFGRDFRYDLELEAKSKSVCVRMMYEEAVVVAFASA